MKSGILFCTPMYGGLCHEAHFRSCLQLKEDLTRTGLDHDWLTGRNESLVHRARNEMTASFLGTDWSHMMWLDADIEFQSEDVAKLWNLDVDIAVGLYCMKRGDLPLSAWKDGRMVVIGDGPQPPFAVDYAGTGFMLIRRTVIETLALSAPSYQGPNGRVPVLYQTPVVDNCFESEDYHFSRISRETGFQVIADPSIRLKHWGQYAYGA